MADNEYLISTRYTTEGYQQAIDRAEKIGVTLRRMGSELVQLGYIIDNQFIKDLGHGIQALQDMASIAEGLVKTLKEIPQALAGGIIFGGSALVADAVGKAYNTASGTVDTGTFVAAAQRLEDALKKIPADQAAAAMETFNIKMQGASSAQRVAGMNALADSIDNIGKTVEKNLPMLSDFYQKTDKLLPRILAFSQAQLDANFESLVTGIGYKMKAATTYQDKLATASQKYHAAEFDRKMKIAQLEAEVSSRRIAAAQSLAADLAKMDSSYYSQRLQLAQSFGLESQRAEEDHQRNMRRLQESHDKRLRKLAESRDALGIEDEVDAFEEERKNAEEDYQTQQARRNQDFAQQLRDMETAFQQQRQERINAYNQQLIDIANYNTAQRNLIAAQMRDIAEAVMTAFTNAAKNFTAAQNTINTTTQTVTQNNTITGVSDPMAVSQMINKRVKEIFDTAARR